MDCLPESGFMMIMICSKANLSLALAVISFIVTDILHNLVEGIILNFGLVVKETMSFKVVHIFKSCSHFSVYNYHMCILDREHYQLLLNLGHLTDLDPNHLTLK